MQACFFALAGVLPTEEALRELKARDRAQSYGARGEVIVERNVAAVDQSLENLHELPLGASRHVRRAPPPGGQRRRSRLRAAGHGPHAGRARATCCR